MENTTELICLPRALPLQNVSHVGHMANQTVFQLITCVMILSVLRLHPCEKDVLTLPWVSLPEAHSVYVTLASFSIVMLSSPMCVLKVVFFV